MNERDPDRAEAIRQIAEILAAAYLRLRFPRKPQNALAVTNDDDADPVETRR